MSTIQPLGEMDGKVWTRLEKLLERFELAWQRGEQPSIVDYLKDAESERKSLLVELVHTDFEFRHRAGDGTRVDGYFGDYAELKGDEKVTVGLIVKEYELRRAKEPDLTHDEFKERFPDLARALTVALQASDQAATDSNGRASGNGTHRALDDGTSPSRKDVESDGADGSSTDARPCGRQFGDYELLEEIGSGGMGVVWKARQKNLDRIVAVKMIQTGLLAPDRDVERFRREAKAAGRLSHANIVAVHEVGEHQGQHFFSMDFLDGVSLQDKVAADGPLAPCVAASYMKTVAEAIHYAHGRNVLHRDIKPGNILIDEFDQPHVTDFGLARIMDEASVETSPMQGTYCFMPPEQIVGGLELPSTESDVYSIGATLYNLIAGRPPFPGFTKSETIQRVLSEDPIPPRRLRMSVPRDLETICLKCMQKERRKRYATAQDLADDLGRFVAGKPIYARPVGTLEKTWRVAKRHPFFSALGVLTVVLLMVCTYLFAAIHSTNRHAVELVRQKQVAEKYQRQAGRAMLTAEAAQFEAEKAQLEAETAKEALRLTHQRTKALSHIVDGVRLLDKGIVAQGLFKIQQGHAIAENHPAIRAAARNHLLGWGDSLGICLKHDSVVTHVALSPDGRTILTTSLENVARLWNASTGEPIGRPAEHAARIDAMAFVPDGTRFVTATRDGTLTQWDARTGDRFGTPLKTTTIRSIDFAPVGNVAVVCLHDEAFFWNVDTGELDGAPIKQTRLNHAQFDPTGKRVMTCGIGYVRVWDVSDRKMLAELRHDGNPHAYAFSPTDHDLVLTGWGNLPNGPRSEGPAAFLWNWRTNQQVRLPVRRRVVEVAFSPDGMRAITGSTDSTAMIWPVQRILDHGASGDPEADIVVTAIAHPAPVTAATFVDDDLVLTAGGDIAIVSTTEEGDVVDRHVFQHQGPIREAIFNRANETVVTMSDDGTARIWPLRPYENRIHQELLPRHVAFSPDGTWLAITESRDPFTDMPEMNGASVHNLATDESWPLELPDDKRALDVTFRDDGALLVAYGDQLVTISDVTTDRGTTNVQPWRDEASPVPAPYAMLALSHDGLTMLATAIESPLAHVWDVSAHQHVASLDHQHEVIALAISPDGTLLATSGGGVVKLWQVTGELLGELPLFGKAAQLMAFSPDGRLVAISTHERVWIWDVDEQKPVTGPFEHDQQVMELLFTHDGLTMITAGQDHLVKMWDVHTGLRRAAPWRHQFRVIGGLAQSPDGSHIATAAGVPYSAGATFLWKIPAGVSDQADSMRQWVEVRTGLRWDGDLEVAVPLSFDQWNDRRAQLAAPATQIDKPVALNSP